MTFSGRREFVEDWTTMLESTMQFARAFQVSSGGYDMQAIHTISMGASGRLLKTRLCVGWGAVFMSGFELRR